MAASGSAVAVAAALLAGSAPPAGPAAVAPPATAAVVYVLPLGGGLADADLAEVQRALGAMYGYQVRVLPRRELPRAAYYPPRGRYRADRLLDLVQAQLPAGGLRLLAVTAADISTTKAPYPDWGVLGLGKIDGPVAVISLHRCRKGSRDAAHARQRLGKVAVHELGHTLGLPHCPSAHCLMRDAAGQVATIDDDSDLCPRCRAALRARGVHLSSTPN